MQCRKELKSISVTMSVEPVGRPENVVRAAVEAAVNKGEAL